MGGKKTKKINPYAKKQKPKVSPWIIAAAAVLVIVLAAGGILIAGRGKKTAASDPADLTVTNHARIEIAGYGTVMAELYGKLAPITVQNFVDLAGSGFYDGLTFHRIISGFMIQGGDPKGNGTGGSDQNIRGEFSANGIKNDLKHTRGVLSMARSQAYDSASSQFFIMHQDAPHLDGQYAAFGRVTEGMDIVDRICEETPVQDGNGTVARQDQPVITSVVITD